MHCYYAYLANGSLSPTRHSHKGNNVNSGILVFHVLRATQTLLQGVREAANLEHSASNNIL